MMGVFGFKNLRSDIFVIPSGVEESLTVESERHLDFARHETVTSRSLASPSRPGHRPRKTPRDNRPQPSRHRVARV